MENQELNKSNSQNNKSENQELNNLNVEEYL